MVFESVIIIYKYKKNECFPIIPGLRQRTTGWCWAMEKGEKASPSPTAQNLFDATSFLGKKTPTSSTPNIFDAATLLGIEIFKLSFMIINTHIKWIFCKYYFKVNMALARLFLWKVLNVNEKKFGKGIKNVFLKKKKNYCMFTLQHMGRYTCLFE